MLWEKSNILHMQKVYDILDVHILAKDETNLSRVGRW